MSGHQRATLEDTVYFWFASNDTSGSGNDGATALFDVREAGAAAGAIPLLSGSPTLLSHANYPPGCYEVAVAATAANGFAADDTFAVFCTLAVDSQNPTGFVGSCTLTPLATSAALATVDSNVDAILIDTAQIGAAGAGLTDLGGMSTAMKAEVNAEADTALSDYDAPTKTEMDSAFTEIKGATWASGTDTLEHIRNKQTDIEADTQDLQTQIGTAGAGLTDVGGFSTAAKAEINTEADTALTDYDPPTKTEMDSAFTEIKGATWASGTDTLEHIRNKQTDIEADTQDLQTQVGTAGAGLTDLGGMSTAMKAEVNTEVVDTLNTDTYAEPGQGAPAATASLAEKINYLYKNWRNKRTQTATTESLYDDAGSTVDQKRTVSDDGTTGTKGEMGTGP